MTTLTYQKQVRIPQDNASGDSTRPSGPPHRTAEANKTRPTRERWKAFIAVGLLVSVLAMDIAVRASSSTVRTGTTADGGRVEEPASVGAAHEPTEAEISWVLSRFIEQARNVPADPIALSHDFLDAYHYADGEGIVALNEYARDSDPYAKALAQSPVRVEISKIARVSDGAYQVSWTERHGDGRKTVDSEQWQAHLKVRAGSPSQRSGNPFGIYVQAVDWTPQRSSAATQD